VSVVATSTRFCLYSILYSGDIGSYSWLFPSFLFRVLLLLLDSPLMSFGIGIIQVSIRSGTVVI